MNRLSLPKNSISFIVELVKASLPTTPFHPHVFRPTRISAIFPPKANSWQSRLPLRSRSGLEVAGAKNSPLAPLCSIMSDTKEIERTHEMMLRYYIICDCYRRWSVVLYPLRDSRVYGNEYTRRSRSDIKSSFVDGSWPYFYNIHSARFAWHRECWVYSKKAQKNIFRPRIHPFIFDKFPLLDIGIIPDLTLGKNH